MLTNLSVANKLRLGIGGLLALLLLLAAGAMLAINRMDAASRQVTTVWLPSLDVAGELNDLALTLRRRELTLGVVTEPARVAVVLESMRTLPERLNAALDRYRPLIVLPEERRIIRELEVALRAHLALNQRLMQAHAAGNIEQVRALAGEGGPGINTITSLLDELRSLNSSEARRAGAEVEAVGRFGDTLIIVLGLIALLVGIAIAVMLTRSITGRLVNLSGAMDKLAKRDYAFTLKETADKDELGAMARAVDTCRAGLQEADRLAAEQAAAAERRAARAARVDALVKEFEAEAADVLRAVSSAATELSATANGMTATAEEGSRQATTVASASQQTSGNVQTVAASTEELSSSIAEVARQVRETASITTRAAETARQTDGTVRSLADAANRIGDVVRLISDIAGQTNLLALNATIEAARAGEAGKGFAVVASEVKSLAAQTAKATEEIAAQITAMQTETQRSVEAIAAIGKTVEELNATTAQVAAASEEQAAATREIGRAVAEAAQGAEETSRSAANVKEGAERTGEAAKDLKGASSELAQQSERMRGQVDRFLADIRAA
ncbi:methyl-accepting chemotaxis protein [Roseococcus thiosulfatophilus]|uniref:methyl-accepting chemotaxis protein n=1 Tax=Roseococcus thiosulfatophilus TaxID=35813 RepID=UPI001A8F936E|nr:methyl-accepting chemotaxis protein [Roseococcus thiosulfatophilus]